MLNYRTEGDGPPLLLIHGFGVTFSIWDHLAPLLRPHFRLIMIELPGLGRSPLTAPDRPYYSYCVEAIEEVRQVLGLQHWSILSYSSGTRVAEAFVQRYPERVSRAVFLCPAYVNGWRPLGLRLSLRLDRRWPQFGDWALSGWRMYLLIVGLGFNGRWNRHAAAWYREVQTQPIESLKLTLRDLPRTDRAHQPWPELPTLFVWGKRDRIPTRPRRPTANDLFIAADHSAPVRAAPAVAEAIIPFLTDPATALPS